ncbi:MAG TPA: M56 family metallopeptidase [Terracidiphilus sp.]|nr:M56 family metallopeptidase [Terracidiphilus sp.]
MIPVFIEAALRSLLVGFAVAVGLRVFRVRNVLAQKSAWGLVLISALAMPLLLPITAQWHLLPVGVDVVVPAHPMTMLEELQARIQGKTGSGSKVATSAAPTRQSDPPRIQASAAPKPSATRRIAERSVPTARMHRTANHETRTPITPDSSVAFSSESKQNAVPAPAMPSPAPVPHNSGSPVALAFALYFGIAALFMIRLSLGFLAAARLWRTAVPISPEQLPRDAASLQVRASSKIASPFTIGSAILLPADFTSWDSEKLRIVLAHERSHIRQGDFYLQLLAGLYTALVWPSPLGWWLKHELAELAEAISDHAAMEEAPSCTSYAQILLEFAAAPRPTPIGIAMARPGSLSRRIERLLNDSSFRQCFTGGRRALVAVALVPLALLASTTLVRVQAAVSAQSASASSTFASPSVTLVAPTFLDAPHLEALQTVPSAQTLQPGDRAFLQWPVTPAMPAVLPQPENSAEVAVLAPAPAIRMAAVVSPVAEGRADEGPSLPFDRTLSVSGTGQLTVSTGSGNIHITRSSGNQIHIHGQIHVHDDGSEEQARQIAANPPIEQNGDSIRVGQHDEQWRGISIDYEIEAPAGTQLAANSGSGDIVDEGVGQNAKLQTGSGDIRATSLEGPFLVKTGSGNITAAQTGHGDVTAETGSGDIELKDVHGSFNGHTGSGNIKASGTPSGQWILHTGSGNIELWTGNAPLTLDASTGSGSVTTEHEMMMQGTLDHHHVHGTLNGGGPTLRAQTGSGDIEIH